MSRSVLHKLSRGRMASESSAWVSGVQWVDERV